MAGQQGGLSKSSYRAKSMAETVFSVGTQVFGAARARINYWRRIFPAYFGGGVSQLTFWHDHPKMNERAFDGKLDQYYQDFSEKADYQGPCDSTGIPLLDYRGNIGKQYNPIAIAQYGLGNYNLYRQGGGEERRHKFLRAAGWLVQHLETNAYGVAVWHHKFDWEYVTLLKAPWYSALAQGQGLSLIVRAFHETQNDLYMDVAEKVFHSFVVGIENGGVSYSDEDGNLWFEEYLVTPPSHVLNGFIWASWGVYDYYLASRNKIAKDLFDRSVRTLASNLWRYDTGFWSLYDLSRTAIRMIASPFYHQLHIVQLLVMQRLTGLAVFEEYARRWNNFSRHKSCRTRALLHKAVFKLCYF